MQLNPMPEHLVNLCRLSGMFVSTQHCVDTGETRTVVSNIPDVFIADMLCVYLSQSNYGLFGLYTNDRSAPEFGRMKVKVYRRTT